MFRKRIASEQACAIHVVGKAFAEPESRYAKVAKKGCVHDHADRPRAHSFVGYSLITTFFPSRCLHESDDVAGKIYSHTLLSAFSMLSLGIPASLARRRADAKLAFVSGSALPDSVEPS